MDDKIELEKSIRQETPPAAVPAGRRQRSRPLWMAGAAIAALLLAATGAWWRLSAPVPVHYVTAPASRGAITQVVTATGTVNPVLTIIVGSYVSGVIQQLFCDYNTRVRAGQVCAKIDPRPYQATLDQYAGQLLRDQATLDKDRMDLARYQKLAEQNSIARQEAEDQFYLVHQDEATVKLDQALVDGAKLNLEYTDIVSPVDGTVVSRNVTGGQTVASTFQTPTLFLIATDLSKMQVDTNSSESDVGGVKEGDQAAFTVDAYPGRAFHGAVTQLRQSPQTVQNVVTYDAVVGVDNSDLALMPGMTASTQIIIAQRSGVLRVPDQTLRYVPSGLAEARAGAPAGRESRIWVLRDGRPVEAPVTLGLDDGSFVEIVRGDIQPGEQVITAETRDQPGGRSGLLPPRP